MDKNPDLINSTETPNQVAPEAQERFSTKSILLMVLLIAVVLILGVSYYFLNKSKQTTLQSITPSTKDTTIAKANPTTSQTVTQNAVNKIAFIKNGTEVWIANEDGTDAQKVLSHQPETFNTSSLTSDENANATKFFNEHYFTDLSWSNDGKKLAVTAFSKLLETQIKDPVLAKKNQVGGQFWFPSHGDIYLIDVASGNTQDIVAKDASTLVGEVRWSYDDKQIVYKQESSTGCGIFLAKADPNNTNAKLLTNYQCQGNNSRQLVWLPDKGLLFFSDYISYSQNDEAQQPPIIRYDYIHNTTSTNPLPHTAGYRLFTYSILNNGEIMYFSTALGPQYGTQYGYYEVRTANIDGTNSKVIYTGNVCGKEEYPGQGGCYYMYFSPNGKYAVGGHSGSYVLNPKAPSEALMPDKVYSYWGWNTDGDKITYMTNQGLAVYNLPTQTKKLIVQDPNISEVRWAYR